MTEEDSDFLATTNDDFDGILIWDLNNTKGRKNLHQNESTDQDYYITSPDDYILLSYTWNKTSPNLIVSYGKEGKNNGKLQSYRVPIDQNLGEKIIEKKSELGKWSLSFDLSLPTHLTAFCTSPESDSVIYGASNSEKLIIDSRNGDIKRMGSKSTTSKSEVEVTVNKRDQVIFWSNNGSIQRFDIRNESEPVETLNLRPGIKTLKFSPTEPSELFIMYNDRLIRNNLNSEKQEYLFSKLSYQQGLT